MSGHVVSLFDRTCNMVMPWADAGYDCWCLDLNPRDDIDHPRIKAVAHDLTAPWLPPFDWSEIVFVSAFPPCTHLAVSGARWFRGKGLRHLAKSIELFASAAEFCEASRAPYMIENPISTISTYWRRPDFKMNPFEFAGLHPEDNYTKATCLWVGGGFVMPKPVPLESPQAPDQRIHLCPPGDGRADFRSATPTGFARAVFAANSEAAS